MGRDRRVRWIGHYTTNNGKGHEIWGCSKEEVLYYGLMVEGNNKPITIYMEHQIDYKKDCILELNQYEIVQTIYRPEVRKKGSKKYKKIEHKIS